MGKFLARGEVKFQFHTGSIRRTRGSIGASSPRRFNSTLDQLEAAGAPSQDFLQEFQFHTGSIRRRIFPSALTSLAYWFQFHTGSIRRRGALYLAIVFILVSIPHWIN